MRSTARVPRGLAAVAAAVGLAVMCPAGSRAQVAAAGPELRQPPRPTDPRAESPAADRASRPLPRPPGPPPDATLVAWDDLDWTLLRMQRESIASQEEMQRESGRGKRRDEVELDKQERSAESEAYFDAVLEASKAALRAPQGVYYRRPGYSSSEAPPNAKSVDVSGIEYLYDQGIFWLLPGPPFVVVAAPVGAVVDKLPAGAYRVGGKAPARYYFFGTFFEEKDGRFEVVKPAAGTLVSYLPDGYQQEQVGGATLYRFGATSFKPIFAQGILVYQVVER